MRSNCLFFAVALYMRRRKAGREGYLVLRRSRLVLLSFHVLYAERRHDGTLRVVSYQPLDPREKKCPPPLFEGRGRWGD